MTKTHKKFPKYMKDQRQFFDELILNDWDSYLSRKWNKERQREVSRLFKTIKPQTVLNVGCGSGYHDKLIAGLPFVTQVTGIDYSQKSIEKANIEYPNSKIIRYVSSFEDCKETNYELVVSFQVIEHLVEPEKFIEHCVNFSSANGFIAIFTPNRMRLTNRVRLALGLKIVFEDPQHFKEFTRRELSQLGEVYGLKTIDYFSYGLTFEMPKLGWQLIPAKLSFWLGRMFPQIANRFAIILKKTS